MESAAIDLRSMMKNDPVETYTELSDKHCPYCGQPMRSFTHTDEHKEDITLYRCMYLSEVKLHGGATGERWIGCDYTLLEDNIKEMVTQAHESNVKAKLMNKFLRGSLIGNRKMLEKTMEQFQVRNEETGKAKSVALEVIDEILNGSYPHFILTGPAGTGKTHLAIATGREVIERSNYTKGALFLSYSELYANYKDSINIPELVKTLLKPLFKEIERSHLLIIDDIGAELGRIETTTSATNYNVELLQRIAEYRTDKATIFTTNLTGKQLINIYGDRIYSRMMSNTRREDGSYRSAKFVNTDDGRTIK